jgi:hypothetical protein
MLIIWLSVPPALKKGEHVPQKGEQQTERQRERMVNDDRNEKQDRKHGQGKPAYK